MVFSGDIRRMATVMTATDRATPTMRRVQAQGDRTADSMGNLGSRARMLGTAFKATAVGAGALAVALGALVATQGRTEQTFARLAEVSGATADQMERVEDKAIDIGKNLPISINQAASAMEQLAFAGFTVQEQLGAANQVANLAVASQMNMQQSARQTASLLNMYGIEAGNAQQVTATLAATFSSSATNMQELTRALSRAGTVASRVGITMQETAAAVGVLADQGIRAARAGQAIRGTLQRLIEPSGAAEERMAAIGLEMENVLNQEGEFRSLNAVVTEFRDSLSDVESQAERTAAVTEIVGRRGARALLPLIENQEALNEKLGDVFRSEVRESMAALGQMSDEQIQNINEMSSVELDIGRDMTGEELASQLNQLHQEGMNVNEMASQLQVALGVSSEAATAMSEDIADASVSTDQVAEAMGGATTASDIAASQMDTVSGSVKFLKSSLDTMAFAIFSGAGPAIQWFNEQLAAGINILNNNEAAMKAVGTVLVAVTAGLATLAAMFGAAYIQAVVIPGIMSAVSGTFITAALSAGTLSGALGILGSAILSVAAPVLVVVAAIGVLVAAFLVVQELIAQNFLGLGEDVQNIMNAISSTMEFLMPILKQLGRLLWEVGKVLLVIAAAPIVVQIVAIIKIISVLIDTIRVAINIITGLINGTLTLGEAFDMAAGAIASFFADIGEFIMNIGSMVVDFLTGIDWGGLAVQAVALLVEGIVTGFLYYITAWKMYLDFLITFWTDMVPSFIAGAITMIIDLIVSGFEALPGLAMDAFMMYLDLVIYFWTDLVPGVIIGAVNALVTGIINGIANIAPQTASKLQDLVNVVSTKFWSLVDMVMGVPGAIIDAIVQGLTDPGAIIDAMFGLAESIISFLPFSNADRGPLSSIMSVGGNIVSAIVDGILAYIGFITDAMAMVGDVIWSAIQAYIDFVTGIGEKLIGIIVDGVTAYISFVKDAFMLIYDVIVTAIEMYIDFVTGVGETIVQTIADGLLGAVSIVTDAIDSVVSAIADFLPFINANRGPLSSIMSVGGNIVSAIADGLTGAVGMVTDAAQAVAGAISDVLGGVADAAMDIGSQIANGVADGINGGVDAVAGAASSVADAASGAVNGAADMVSGAGEAVTDAVSSGIDSGTDAVADAASGAAGAVAGAMPFSNADFGPLSNIMDVGNNIVQSVSQGIAGNQDQLAGNAAGMMQGVMGAVQDTPVGEAASGLMGEAAGALGGTVLGGASDSKPAASPAKSSGDGRSDGKTSQGGADGFKIEINQEINAGSGDAEEIRKAAEEGSRSGIEETIKELERLLEQDMNA
jgi:TP901 family phage tail tape measure protein